MGSFFFLLFIVYLVLVFFILFIVFFIILKKMLKIGFWKFLNRFNVGSVDRFFVVFFFDIYYFSVFYCFNSFGRYVGKFRFRRGSYLLRVVLVFGEELGDLDLIRGYFIY